MDKQTEIVAKKHYYLGRLYHFGMPWLMNDGEISFKHFKKSARLGYREGMLQLGLCYCYGYGCDSDLSRAIQLFLLGDTQDCRYYLGRCYLLGWGVERSYEKAAAIFDRLVEGGYPYAAMMLGMMHRDGKGFPKSDEMMAKYYLLAAELGCDEGCYRIARCYENGIGVERNPEEAKRWYARWSELYRDPEDMIFYDERDPEEYEEAMRFFKEQAEAGDEDCAFIIKESKKTRPR